MPTAIYDSSLLTKRKRDKIIAQEIQQRNNQGVQIITPQTGYGAYIMEEVDNGSITQFRKGEGCTNVNLACSCLSQQIIPIILGIDNITFVLNIENSNEITVLVSGNGTIDWGDGRSDSFNSVTEYPLNHSYNTPQLYTVVLNGNIFLLALSSAISKFIGYNYPKVISVTFNKISNLNTFSLVQNTVTSINNPLLLANTITDFSAGNNSIDYSFVFSFNKLTNIFLSNIILSGIFDCNSFPNLTDLFVQDCVNITSIINLPNTLEIFDIQNTPISILPPLPGSLSQLWIPGTGISSLPATLPTNLTILSIPNTTINTLPTLPNTLVSLNIEDTGIPSLPNPLPPQLVTLIFSNTSINSIPSLPTTLVQLKCNNNTSINTIPTLPISIIILECENCNINQTTADNIAANLVSNGQTDGNLQIINQNGPTTINTTGGDWDILISNNWTIT